jgi:hypothetical protein
MSSDMDELVHISERDGKKEGKTSMKTSTKFMSMNMKRKHIIIFELLGLFGGMMS